MRRGDYHHGSVSRLAEKFQVRKAKTPTVSDRCLGFSLNLEDFNFLFSSNVPWRIQTQ